MEKGLALTEFGSRCDSLPVCLKLLPSDSVLRSTWLGLGNGVMGFCPLIRCDLNYYVKVDLRKGIMIVSNDHRWAKQT